MNDSVHSYMLCILSTSVAAATDGGGPSVDKLVARVAALEKELQAARQQVHRLRAELAPARSSPSALKATLHVAHLTNGSIPMPASTENVIMEIGCSDMFTLDEHLLPHDTNFLISFEPLLEKYAVLLARGTPRFHPEGGGDRSVPLAHHHRRGVVLPIAVSPQGGAVGSFKVSTRAGCSSMLPVVNSTSWGQFCAELLDTREVPSISLETALGLVPPHLPVAHLKLDVQGVDLALIQSVDAALLRRRVSTFSMEVVAEDCNPLYVGQPRCAEVLRYARSIGYVPYGEEGARGGKSFSCRGWRECDEVKEASCSVKMCEKDINFQRRAES